MEIERVQEQEGFEFACSVFGFGMSLTIRDFKSAERTCSSLLRTFFLCGFLRPLYASVGFFVWHWRSGHLIASCSPTLGRIAWNQNLWSLPSLRCSILAHPSKAFCIYHEFSGPRDGGRSHVSRINKNGAVRANT